MFVEQLQKHLQQITTRGQQHIIIMQLGVLIISNSRSLICIIHHNLIHSENMCGHEPAEQTIKVFFGGSRF